MADRLEKETVGAIADRLDDLPATIRPRATELINKADCEIETTSVAESAVEVGDRLAKCRQRVDAIDPA